MTDNSRKIEGAVEIARDPREVFAYVTDPVRLPEWQPDVVRAAFADPSASLSPTWRQRPVPVSARPSS